MNTCTQYINTVHEQSTVPIVFNLAIMRTRYRQRRTCVMDPKCVFPLETKALMAGDERIDG